MRPRVPRRRLLAWGLLAAACYSPTLPLPPPGRPTVTSVEGTDRYLLAGRVEPKARVFAINVHTNAIVGFHTGADGAYTLEVRGTEGDQMRLWYTIGTDSSPFVEFLLPPTSAAPGGEAGAAGAGG